MIVKKLIRKIFPANLINTMWLIRSSTYNEDGMATCHNCDFMKDELFLQSYNLGKNTKSWGGWKVHYRVYICCWAANKARSLEGDFVECGVNMGGYSRAVIHYVDFHTLDKKFYLLDTFCGLSSELVSEEEKKRGVLDTYNHYTPCYDSVKETFKDFNVELVKGTVPETLSQVKTDKVCYLSIDMNCAAPEIAAIEFFWNRLVSGAVVVLDDYGWNLHIEQKRAFDDFCFKKNVQVLSLPTGQGLIFKP